MKRMRPANQRKHDPVAWKATGFPRHSIAEELRNIPHCQEGGAIYQPRGTRYKITCLRTTNPHNMITEERSTMDRPMGTGRTIARIFESSGS